MPSSIPTFNWKSYRPLALASALLVLVDRAGAESVPCAQVQSELRSVDRALELYHVKHGSYPPAAHWFKALQDEGLIRAELSGRDQWAHPYLFVPSADQRSFDLRSLGPDGVQGTADDQAKADDWRWSRCQSARGGC